MIETPLDTHVYIKGSTINQSILDYLGYIFILNNGIPKVNRTFTIGIYRKIYTDFSFWGSNEDVISLKHFIKISKKCYAKKGQI